MQKESKIGTAKIMTVIVTTIMFFVLVIMIFQFANITNLKNNEKQLNARISDLEKQIVYYNNENSYLSSAEFLEDYAREVLGLKKDGETIFR